MSLSPRDPSADPADFDIDAREAQVLGKPQRIEPLKQEDFDDEANPAAGSMLEWVQMQQEMLLAEALERTPLRAEGE